MQRRLSVLVVDDEELSCRLAEALFTREGHDVRVVTDPLEVPAEFKNPPDLVILDVNMPTLDGDTVIHILKEKLPNRTPPLVLVSNLEPEVLRERAEAAGADHWVSKPLTRFAVQEILRSFFGE